MAGMVRAVLVLAAFESLVLFSSSTDTEEVESYVWGNLILGVKVVASFSLSLLRKSLFPHRLASSSLCALGPELILLPLTLGC